MAWNEQTARERVSSNDFHDFDVNVADLSRSMDFANLGTRDVRRAEGVHIYGDVPNFHAAVDEAGADKAKQKKLIRAASVLRRAQIDLVEKRDVGKIQLQAARLHCLCYKPYDSDADRAKQAVILAIDLNSYLYDVFNGVFDDMTPLHAAVGMASGTSYIANIGFTGDRERICLGTCANLGAKVINGRDTITITEDVYSLLPACLQEHFDEARTVAGAKTYRAVGLRWGNYPDLADELDVQFDTDRLKTKTEEYRDALPLADIQIAEAEVLIDLDDRSERDSKRTSAVALYADLDGFTRYVQEAEDDDAIVSLVRTLHMIRHEFHAVLKQDYPGVVLQHQGDRTFAIIHLPTGDDADKQCQKAVDAAIGLQSSMEHVLNERLGHRKDIHVAIGLDSGTALVTRLGKKGKREAVCFGPRVTSAERLQLDSSGQEIRISDAVYEALDDDVLREQFEDVGDDAHVAKRLTFPRLDDLREEHAAAAGTLGARVNDGRVEVATTNTPQRGPWASPKPWTTK